MTYRYLYEIATRLCRKNKWGAGTVLCRAKGDASSIFPYNASLWWITAFGKQVVLVRAWNGQYWEREDVLSIDEDTRLAVAKGPFPKDAPLAMERALAHSEIVNAAEDVATAQKTLSEARRELARKRRREAKAYRELARLDKKAAKGARR